METSKLQIQNINQALQHALSNDAREEATQSIDLIIKFIRQSTVHAFQLLKVDQICILGQLMKLVLKYPDLEEADTVFYAIANGSGQRNLPFWQILEQNFDVGDNLATVLRVMTILARTRSILPPYAYFWLVGQPSSCIALEQDDSFSPTMTLCAWIRPQGFQSDCIVVNHGGVKLMITEFRLFTMDSHSALLLTDNEWAFIAVVIKSGDQVSFCVDGEWMKSPISTSVALSRRVLFHGFNGHISCILKFSKALPSDVIDQIRTYHHYGPYQAETLAGLEGTLPKQAKANLASLWHPLRTSSETVYDVISGKNATVQSGGVFVHNHFAPTSAKTLLPIFQQALQATTSDWDGLIDVLSLLQQWFDNYHDAQLEARRCKFFVAFAKCLERTSQSISLDAIEILGGIADSVVPQLQDVIAEKVLWRFEEIWFSLPLLIQQRVAELLLLLYSQSPKLAPKFTCDKILNLLEQLGTDQHREPIKQCLIEIIELIISGGRVQESETLVWAFYTVENDYLLLGLLQTLLKIFVSSVGQETAVLLGSCGGIEALLNLCQHPMHEIRCRSLSCLDIILECTKTLPTQLRDIDSYINSTIQMYFTELSDPSQYDEVYVTLLELLLKRSFRVASLVDNSDFIQNPNILQHLLAMQGCLPETTKIKMLQDLLLLTKWNEDNAVTVVKNLDWVAWVFDVLTKTWEQEGSGSVMLQDLALRVATVLIHKAMGSSIQLFSEVTSKLFIWYSENQVNELSARLVQKVLFTVIETCVTEPCTPHESLVQLGFVVEETAIGVLCRDAELAKSGAATVISAAIPWTGETDQHGAQYLPYILYDSQEFDQGLIETYFIIFDRLFPGDIFETAQEDHVHIARTIFDNIGKSLFKQELGLLTTEYFKQPNRGQFVRVVVALACFSIARSKATYEKWIFQLLKIVKYILIGMETAKKAKSQYKEFDKTILCITEFLFQQG